uniref:Histone H4 n=1 Tax=Panagrolaimus davidi TaxID=227884 RepID=A0A914QJN1_9BILA
MVRKRSGPNRFSPSPLATTTKSIIITTNTTADANNIEVPTQQSSPPTVDTVDDVNQIVIPKATPTAANTTIGIQVQRGIKRHPKIEKINGMSTCSIKRLARRAGVSRVSKQIIPPIREILKEYVTDVMSDAIQITGQRKTVTCMDVLYALKRRGNTLYR